jgi:trehalose-phosphatase
MKNIFYHWNKLKEGLNNKYIMLFLDYDGTLASIAKTPDKAVIPQETRRLLSLLSQRKNCRIAIISGRDLVDIKKMVGLKNIIYSGNHGFQIEGPKIKYELAVSLSYQEALQRIKTQLKEKLSGIRGVFVEDKNLSLAVHFRLADRKQLPIIKSIFHEITAVYLVKNKIKIRSGKKVLEVRPPVQWDKGKVALWLLARQMFALKKESVLPIYIGDDLTDEDAFKALKRKGLTVFVGEPGNSKANYCLRDTREVAKFLRLILDLGPN